MALGTLWAAYNGVTELVDHSAGPLVGPRAVENSRQLPQRGALAGARRARTPLAPARDFGLDT